MPGVPDHRTVLLAKAKQDRHLAMLVEDEPGFDRAAAIALATLAIEWAEGIAEG